MWSFVKGLNEWSGLIALVFAVPGYIAYVSETARRWMQDKVLVGWSLIALLVIMLALNFGAKLDWLTPELEEILNRTYTDEVVVIDGKAFHGCVFDHVRFSYSGGPFKFGDGNRFSPGTKLESSNIPIKNALAILGATGIFRACAPYTIPKSQMTP